MEVGTGIEYQSRTANASRGHAPNFRRALPTPVAVTLQTSVAHCQLQSRSRSKLQSRAANSSPGRSPLPPLSMLARGPGRPARAANSPIPRFRASTGGPPPFCYSNTTAAGIPREKSGSRGEKVEARTSMGPGRNCAGKAALRGGLHARGFRAGNGAFQRAPRRGLKRSLSSPMDVFKFGPKRGSPRGKPILFLFRLSLSRLRPGWSRGAAAPPPPAAPLHAGRTSARGGVSTRVQTLVPG